MAQSKDGGEAILEAFRNLEIDYIISSPGSEWAPVWEALARQKINETEGPTYINCWHETLAVDMALAIPGLPASSRPCCFMPVSDYCREVSASTGPA